VDPALDALLKSQSALWRGRDRYNDAESVTTGFTELDEVLPAQGWPVGGVTELLVEQQGIGELSLLLPALCQLTSNGQWAVCINPPHIPYAPALSNAGIQLDRLLIINSKTDANTLWATEQVLRTGLFAAVIAWVTRSSAQKQRRLQLAAEAGKTWATVYRPATAKNEHSPVTARIVTGISNRHLSLDIIKVRGGNPQTITISQTRFDHPQGAEWPVMANGESAQPNRLLCNVTDG
jgi:cell division inhibitor SulA/protein ImuA